MKEIRSKYVKDSLLDYAQLTNSLKENTTSAVKDLLSEAVRETYNKILSESEDDFDEEEVEDTDSDNGNMESNNTNEVSTDGNTTEETTTEVTPDGAVEQKTEGSDDEGNEWSEFEKYKVSDDKYDFSNAEDEEIVRAYKLMKDEDQLIVTKDGDKVHLQDNETGADYIIDLGSVPDEEDASEENDGDDAVEASYDDEEDENAYEVEMDSDDDDNEEDDNIMNEQRIFEIALNEYDSHVGYTDNYQKKDVMTNPGMSEPAKSSSTNDWDKGTPHGTEKPWSGKKDKYNAPFNGEKGTTVEEGMNECGGMIEDEEDFSQIEPVEEGMNVGGFVQQNSTTHSRIPNSNGRKARNSHVAGNHTKGTPTPRYSSSESANESIVRKANAIYEENQQLKKILGEFKNTLNEAAVTNVNLGKIIKLISENSTTTDEKKEIIARFGKEAKTIDQANSLYESISNDLKKKGKMNLEEGKQFTANSSKLINETQIYKSKDLMESLGMMHKLCKL